jgi:6-phosphofructokinase
VKAVMKNSEVWVILRKRKEAYMGIETRMMIIGYVQRGETPTPNERITTL